MDHKNNGRLAEWLGIGLQNRVRRFESATDLNQNPLTERSEGDFLFSAPNGACSGEEMKTKKTTSAAGRQ